MQKNKKVNHIHSKVTFKAGLVIKTFLKKTLQITSKFKRILNLNNPKKLHFVRKRPIDWFKKEKQAGAELCQAYAKFG